MTGYRIVWEIDVIADTPRAAAQQALAIQRDRSSIATVFDVIEHDQADGVRIDLEDDDAVR